MTTPSVPSRRIAPLLREYDRICAFSLRQSKRSRSADRSSRALPSPPISNLSPANSYRFCIHEQKNVVVDAAPICQTNAATGQIENAGALHHL
jgi:hypothetical protein